MDKHARNLIILLGQ